MVSVIPVIGPWSHTTSLPVPGNSMKCYPWSICKPNGILGVFVYKGHIWWWHDHSRHQNKYDLYFIASPISQNYLPFRSWLRGAQCACTHGPGAPKIMEDIRCRRNKQKCITMWIKHFKRFWGMHLLHLGGCTASWTINQGKHEARQPNTQAGSFNNTHHSLPGKTAHIWERLQQHRPAPKQ